MRVTTSLIVEDSAGVDTLSGGLGDDYYSFNTVSQVIVIEQAGQGIDTVGTVLGVSLMNVRDSAGNVADIENLRAAAVTNMMLTLIGNHLNNTITASNGHDTLDGGSGNDNLIGGKGRDNLLGGSGNDILAGEADSDTLEGGSGNDELIGGSGNDILIAGQGSDYLEGGEGADHLITEDTEGIDILVGGNGSDYYSIAQASTVIVVEQADQGTDTVRTLFSIDLTHLKDDAGNVAQLENLEAYPFTGFSSIERDNNPKF